MSNMSYCRFENTVIDLKDCVGAMEEACTLADLDPSSEELAAMEQMKFLCRRFLKQYEHLQQAEADSANVEA